MQYTSTPENKDPRLWEMARRRAAFKRHFATYIVINILLWALWAMTGADYDGRGIPWPAWTTFGWGIGVLFHYIGTYVRTNDVEREYEKLQNNQKQ